MRGAGMIGWEWTLSKGDEGICLEFSLGGWDPGSSELLVGTDMLEAVSQGGHSMRAITTAEMEAPLWVLRQGQGLGHFVEYVRTSSIWVFYYRVSSKSRVGDRNQLALWQWAGGHTAWQYPKAVSGDHSAVRKISHQGTICYYMNLREITDRSAYMRYHTGHKYDSASIETNKSIAKTSTVSMTQPRLLYGRQQKLSWNEDEIFNTRGTNQMALRNLPPGRIPPFLNEICA